MHSHSSNDQIFFTLSLITTKSFITIPVYINIERHLPFLREFFIVCFSSQCRFAANTHTITDLYNIIEYHMTTVTKKAHTLN